MDEEDEAREGPDDEVDGGDEVRAGEVVVSIVLKI